MMNPESLDLLHGYFDYRMGPGERCAAGWEVVESGFVSFPRGFPGLGTADAQKGR